MRKHLSLSLSLVFCTLLANMGFSQSPVKFDRTLAAKSQAFLSGSSDGKEMLSVIVKGNVSEIKKLVEANGGVFKYAYNGIASIKIPVSALPSFWESKAIARMEGTPPHIRPLNDTMRMRNHIVEVQMGQAPLTQGYDGKGVVVGFIDSGIDFLHADFRDSAGGSRVQYLWDMNQPVGKNTPMPYGYGQAWSKKQIDSVMANSDSAAIHTMDSSENLEWSHGSGVAGVATGNGKANGLNMGIATRADIIMVAYNFTNQTNNEMTDAVNYIYAKAAELGEPCVINASLGDYGGSHDGFDLQSQMIDGMITSKTGQVMVAAAGNAGATDYHVGYNVSSPDTSFTWFSYNGSNVDIQVYSDTASFRNVQFAIGVDKNNPDFVYRAQTKFSTIFPYLSGNPTDTVKNGLGQRLGIITYYAQLSGGTYSLEFVIVPDSTNYYWRFIATGNGKFDCWDYANIVNTGLPSVVQFPAIKNYKLPDTLETLCSGFQCSSNVITVANYNNRNAMIDYDTVLIVDTASGAMPGKRAFNSSLGPTRDGRIKPDIAATGDYTLSCLATGLRSLYIAGSPKTIDVGACHFADGGTSTASPVVAGTAALMLQRNPNATNLEIRNAIVYCADEDIYTGFSLPTPAWGFGKVDAFKAMTGCVLGIIPLSSTVPPSDLSAYPNPMNQSTEMAYDFSAIKEYCTANIMLYDVMGKAIESIELKDSKGKVNLDRNTLSAGTYFYSLSIDGKRIKTEKLVVM
jgi:subtilisin family serine protease